MENDPLALFNVLKLLIALIRAIHKCRLKTNMDKIDWFNDFYSDMFSLNFDST